MKYPRFYAIMITVKNPPLIRACSSFEVGRMICDLRSDHSFDHLQVWTTWEEWTLWHEKARFSDEKTPKSTQNEAKDCYCFLWELDAAGSSPVTSTKNQRRGFAPPLVFARIDSLTQTRLQGRRPWNSVRVLSRVAPQTKIGKPPNQAFKKPIFC